MAIGEPHKSTIEDYLSRAGITPIAFGRATVKGPKLDFDLRGGRTPTARLMGPVKDWKANHPPPSTEAAR